MVEQGDLAVVQNGRVSGFALYSLGLSEVCLIIGLFNMLNAVLVGLFG